jgi:predicted nicotinamide N-methyase
MAEFLFKVGVIFLVLYGLGIIFVMYTDKHGAPWVPTPFKKVRKMLHMAQVKPGEVVLDLGSGDGRVLVVAAREFGAQAVGIEIDPLRVLWTRLWLRALRLQHQARVVRGNLFTAEIGEADVVTLFLRQSTNQLLMVKLLLELRPETRVVSHMFTFPGWEIIDQDRDAKLFLYKVGMKGMEEPAPAIQVSASES